MYLHHQLSTKVKQKVLVSQKILLFQGESKSVRTWNQMMRQAACAENIYHSPSAKTKRCPGVFGKSLNWHPRLIWLFGGVRAGRVGFAGSLGSHELRLCFGQAEPLLLLSAIRFVSGSLRKVLLAH